MLAEYQNNREKPINAGKNEKNANQHMMNAKEALGVKINSGDALETYLSAVVPGVYNDLPFLSRSFVTGNGGFTLTSCICEPASSVSLGF